MKQAIVLILVGLLVAPLLIVVPVLIALRRARRSRGGDGEPDAG